MARRALKGINWAAIAERVPEYEKGNFAIFKSKSDQFLRRLQENPETPAKIDWAYYKKSIPVPGMVDRFQKEYESLSVPYPADNYTATLDSQEAAVLQEVQQFIQESNKRIDEYQTEAEKLKNMIPFEQMTLEDFAEAYPDIAYNIDKPTIWPHEPEDQPGDEPEPMPKAEH